MTVILPGATLGVMGGGQLARMFVHAAQRMGYFTAVLDPDPASPAGLISHYHIQTNYLDEQGLAQLMQRSAAITTEFENVPAPALVTLGAHRPVAPAAEPVAIAQDRSQEKVHFARCGIPCAPYALIETPEQLAAAKAELLPGVLKTSRLGYDGKGQVRVKNRQELQAAWEELKRVPCVLEKLLPLAAECSVIVARGHDGQMVHLRPQLNRHRGGILAATEAYPDSVPAAAARQGVIAAKAIAEGLAYVGVLCIEFFILGDGSLVANEMAPRPHNSGHYSIDACDVSQFELQVRALAGLPLPAPRQHSPAIMLNLLGELWFAQGDAEVTPPWDRVLALPGTHLHLYGKLSARKGRKMGHLTITGPAVEGVRATAMKAAGLLGIEPF
jgi:5-(carboxyamino)imidazole ribonucleotide synthase